MSDQLTAPDALRQPTSAAKPLLEVTDLQRYFPFREVQGLRMVKATVKAVDGISFTLRQGQTLGLVGESGCGKSTTARLVTRLDEPTAGSVVFEGRDITHLKEHELRSIRRDVQMIFQDPYSSLNPRHTIGSILTTPLKVHGLHKGERESVRVQELLRARRPQPRAHQPLPVGVLGRPAPAHRHRPRPGGRAQADHRRRAGLGPRRVDPGPGDEPPRHELLVTSSTSRSSSSPTTSGVVRHFCDQVAVMYLGKIVEYGDKKKIYEAPEHPYTQALLSAAPDINVARGIAPKERIRLVGDVPSPIDPPSGCRFRTRCWKAQDICAQVEPPLMTSVEDTTSVRAKRDRGLHLQACHFAEVKTTLVAEVPTEPVA